jgi:hypothetical protein
MPLDTVLTLLNVVWGLVLTGIGIEMVNNPPDVRWKRWVYRILFIVFGIAVIATTAIQSARNTSEQVRLHQEAEGMERQLSNKVSEQGGKLDAIAHFEQQFLSFVAQRPSGSSDATAKAYEAMAATVMRLAQSSTSQTPPPPGGRLDILYEGSELNGKTITVPANPNGMAQLSPIHTKNVGNKATGQVSARLYFSKLVTGGIWTGWQGTESEEEGYPSCFYAAGMPPIFINPKETWNWQPFTAQFQNWQQGEAITVKVKFFYGTDKPSEATFSIRRQ